MFEIMFVGWIIASIGNAAYVKEHKKGNAGYWFLGSLALSPLIAAILIAGLEGKNAERE